MQAHGIQGRALAIIKVLLRKSSLTKFFISTFKNFIRSYTKLTRSVLRSWNFVSNTFSNQPQVPVINTTMMNSELSLHNRGATTIRTDYNPAGNSRPHDICRSPTYIYQPTLGSSKTRTGPRHPRIQYSTIPAHGHVGTRYSHHLSTPSARVAILIIE